MIPRVKNVLRKNAMLRLVLSSILAVVLVLTGCSGTTLGHHDIARNLPEQRIPGLGGLIGLPIDLSAITLEVSGGEDFEREDYGYLTDANVEAVYLAINARSIDPTVDTQEDGIADTFDFADSVDVYLVANFGGQENRELVAFLPSGDPQLSSGMTRINLQVTGIDVLPFVEAASGYRVDISATGSPPADDVLFGGKVRFRAGIGRR